MKITAKPEVAPDKARDAYLSVYFDDLALEPPISEAARDVGTNMAQTREAQERSNFWPEVVGAAFDKAFEAATQGALVLHCETIDIAQRNVNASLAFVRKLAAARNLSEILELQAAYWRNRFSAFMGQAQELRALSTKVTADMTEPIEGMSSSLGDLRRES
jgi:hypothetical protein